MMEDHEFVEFLLAMHHCKSLWNLKTCTNTSIQDITWNFKELKMQLTTRSYYKQNAITSRQERIELRVVVMSRKEENQALASSHTLPLKDFGERNAYVFVNRLGVRV
jgi:hypothetical protein